jgi:hypothetical protein
MKKLFSIGVAAIGMAAVLVEGFSGSVSASGAVSGLNGKVSGLYGGVDGEDTTAAEASISIPLGNQFGFQADGLIGEIDPENVYGIGGHLFWRNSQLALLGITGTWAEYNDVGINRVGIEGEYYLNQFTFAAALGRQGGDINNAAYGGIEARYYPVANLLLSAAWNRADNQDLYGLGAEWQTPISWLSVFAQLASGNNDYDHAFGGLRFYIGEMKTLVRRHREDDPPSMLLQSLTANLRAARAAAKAQDPGEGNDQVIPVPGGDQEVTPGGDNPGDDGPEGVSPGDNPSDDEPIEEKPDKKKDHHKK